MSQEDHRTIREQLGACALGQLDAGERIAVQAHLDGCPSCRAELAAIAPLAVPLRAVRPERIDTRPVPPPELGEAVLARIRAEAALSPEMVEQGPGAGTATPPVRTIPVRPASERGARWLRPAAAAAVVLVAAGAIGFGLAAQGQDGPKVALESVAVRTAAAELLASAQVVPHTWGVEIKLVATGFERGQPYHVSVTDDRGRTVEAGGFVGTGTEQMRCNLNSSVLRADAAAFQVMDQDGAVVLSGGL